MQISRRLINSFSSLYYDRNKICIYLRIQAQFIIGLGNTYNQAENYQKCNSKHY